MNVAAPVALLEDSRVARLFAALDGRGEEARIVGGAVRDALAGRPVLDIDLATTALPAIVMERAKTAQLRTIPTGLAHGTVTVLVEERPFEVTTLREDIDTDGRHAIVRFGRDFDADARRRDFTINALSLAADGTVHDPVGGIADLASGHVRFIGQARQRIEEDYLRILRFFRFHAGFGRGPMDAQAFSAIIACRDGLARLSAERVRAELLKLFVAPGAPAVVHDIADAGLLQMLFGGIAMPQRLAKIAAIEQMQDAHPNAVLRLAALAIFVSEDAARMRDRLRLSNAEHRRLEAFADAAIALHGKDHAPDNAEIDRMLLEAGRQATRDALMMAHAESHAGPDDADWLNAHKRAAKGAQPTLPVTGEDLMQRGLPQGRAVGGALKALQAKWIRAGFPREPAIVAQLIDDVLADLES